MPVQSRDATCGCISDKGEQQVMTLRDLRCNKTLTDEGLATSLGLERQGDRKANSRC